MEFNNYNMDESKPIFTTASDSQATTTMVRKHLALIFNLNYHNVFCVHLLSFIVSFFYIRVYEIYRTCLAIF